LSHLSAEMERRKKKRRAEIFADKEKGKKRKGRGLYHVGHKEIPRKILLCRLSEKQLYRLYLGSRRKERGERPLDLPPSSKKHSRTHGRRGNAAKERKKAVPGLREAGKREGHGIRSSPPRKEEGPPRAKKKRKSGHHLLG